MKRAPHIILGVSTHTSQKIELLKNNGEQEIYVLDINQLDQIKEKDGVTYISEEVVSKLLRTKADVVFHMYKPKKENE